MGRPAPPTADHEAIAACPQAIAAWVAGCLQARKHPAGRDELDRVTKVIGRLLPAIGEASGESTGEAVGAPRAAVTAATVAADFDATLRSLAGG